MFPARAGMNRGQKSGQSDTSYVPRTCGDEPQAQAMLRLDPEMFPARAGMNRVHGFFQFFKLYVPRTCGDEPLIGDALAENSACSPHVRG